MEKEEEEEEEELSYEGAAGVPPFMRERIVVICPSREGEGGAHLFEATVTGTLRLPIQMGRDLQGMRGTQFERCQREQRIS
jgi:hypothetical protein